MKLVQAVIQPTKLQSVQEALKQVDIIRMTVCDGQAFVDTDHNALLYRGVGYQTSVLRKVVLEIVVNDDFVEKAIETIEKMAKTQHGGNVEDGKIFVLPIDEAIQLHPKQSGPGAV